MAVAAAVVAIATPARYLVRLSKHFEHRVAVQRDEHSARITFPDSVCIVSTTDTTLELRIEAPPNHSPVVRRC